MGDGAGRAQRESEEERAVAVCAKGAVGRYSARRGVSDVLIIAVLPAVEAWQRRRRWQARALTTRDS